jgi:hypothetical protein
MIPPWKVSPTDFWIVGDCIGFIDSSFLSQEFKIKQINNDIKPIVLLFIIQIY